MATRKIITKQNNNIPLVLLEKCKEINSIDNNIKRIAQDLMDTAIDPKTKAAGLAAPQIGESIRMCVVRDIDYTYNNEEKERSTDYLLINPKLIHASDRQGINWEGCVSLPDTYGLVKRARTVKVLAINIDGKNITLTAKGEFARVILHELDHLDGILFTEHVIGNLLSEKELDKHLNNKYQI